MRHLISACDLEFLRSFEQCDIPIAEFRHREHLRIAYILLIQEETPEEAHRRLRELIHQFLISHDHTIKIYNETLTGAWLLAVRHFMHQSDPAQGTADFLDKNPSLLDKSIMLTHYSKERISSQEAREQFLEPDRDPIPRYG